MVIRDDLINNFLLSLKKPHILYKFWQFLLALKKWEYTTSKDQKILIYDFIDDLSSSLYKETFLKVVDLLYEKISFNQLQKRIVSLLPIQQTEITETKAEEYLIKMVENIKDYFVGKVILRMAEAYTSILSQESVRIGAVSKDIKFLNWLNTYDIGDIETSFNPMDENSITIMNELLNEERKKVQSPFPSVLPYFETGRMYIFAGGAKAGKSFLMVNLADYFVFKLKMPVLYFSMENKTTETLSRLIACHYDIPETGVKDKFNDWVNEIKNIQTPLIIERGVGMTADDVLFYFNKYDDPKPKVIIIDYLDLLEGGSSDNMFEKYAEISRRLFKIAQQTKTILLVPTQLNREGVKKMLSGGENEVEKLQVTNISRSWGKVEPADAVFLISRSKEYENSVLLKLDMCRYSQTPKHMYVPIDFSKSKYYFEKSLFNRGISRLNDDLTDDIDVNDNNNGEVSDLDFVD